MKRIKGPAVFLAQFVSDAAPFNSLRSICRWAASNGFRGVQVPTWERSLFNLEKAAASDAYCDKIRSICDDEGVEITELSSHLQGQLVAVHPAYDEQFDAFAPASVRGNRNARTAWAVEQLKLAAQASRRLGLTAHGTFPGSLLWHTVYPWPQRPQGLVEQGFAELARRWRPLLDAFDQCNVDLCYEIHPGEDLHDGATFDRFLDATGNHGRAKILFDPSHLLLQQIDYLAFIDIYHERIGMFHVKDAEFLPNGRSGLYGGYQDWLDRPGRFRSVGDGQIDFASIFSKLTRYGFDGWAVLEWECCIKQPEQGAREGAQFILEHLITPTDKAFDDFAGAGADEARNRRILGLSATESKTQ